MSIEIIIPHVGATGGDVRILAWLVSPGDFVAAGTPLVTIETDKATEDIEAYSEGYVDEILAEAGSDVPVGSVIATLRHDATSEVVDGEVETSLFAETEPPYQPSLPSCIPEHVKSVSSIGPKRIFASPAARRLAREKNIDLAALSGGRESQTIHLAHVEQAILSRLAKQMAPAASKLESEAARPIRASQPPKGKLVTEATVIGDDTSSNGSSPPASRVRRAIAARVSQSRDEIPHFYLSMNVDMTEANLARKWLLKASESSQVVGPTINDLIVRATAFALRDIPQLNALYRNDNVQMLESIDVGIVVGTEDAVLIPIVANVDLLDIYALAEATRALKLGAQEGTLASKQLKGGAVSVSNLGMYGVESFTAIIDPAQSSILACGAIKQTPAVSDSELVIREQMTVTLSVDHRVADGVVAAKFLNRFKYYLEIPQLLITGKGCDRK